MNVKRQQESPWSVGRAPDENGSDANRIEALVEQIGPLLAGKPSQVQGAVLADLVGIWLAGHVVAHDARATSKMRSELLTGHIAAVRQLTWINGNKMGTNPPAGPDYWMRETSGVLRPAVEALLSGGPLTAEHVATLRAYLRQWIMAPAWDANPHPDNQALLAQLRAAIDGLTSRAAIDSWIATASDHGFDPL